MKFQVYLIVLFLFLTACNVNETPVVVNGDVECESDRDCDEGICDEGTCVEAPLWDFLENCEQDSDCRSGICVDSSEGLVCSESCSDDTDCDIAEGWSCQFAAEYGEEICLQVAEQGLPASGSTLCGAGGISQGDGYRLEHCLAPFDSPSEMLVGEGIRLESGAFGAITE